MPDILIRNVSEATAAAIQTHAAAAGQSQQQYLQALLEGLTQQPIVRQRYTVKAVGPESARCHIRRDHAGIIGRGATDCGQSQFAAYKRAIDLIERNAPGDREQAIGLLHEQFEDVFEVAGN